MMKTLKRTIEKEVSYDWKEEGLFKILYKIMFYSEVDIL